MKPVLIVAIVMLGTLASGCTVTHRVEASEPIRIELAIRIDQEVRVRLDDDVESLIQNNPDLF